MADTDTVSVYQPPDTSSAGGSPDPDQKPWELYAKKKGGTVAPAPTAPPIPQLPDFSGNPQGVARLPFGTNYTLNGGTFAAIHPTPPNAGFFPNAGPGSPGVPPVPDPDQKPWELYAKAKTAPAAQSTAQPIPTKDSYKISDFSGPILGYQSMPTNLREQFVQGSDVLHESPPGLLGVSPQGIQTAADYYTSKLPESIRQTVKAIEIPQIAAAKTLAGFADWATSPSGSAQLALAKIPVTQIPMAVKFFYDMAKGGGEAASDMIDKWEAKDYQGFADSLAATIANVAGAGVLGVQGVKTILPKGKPAFQGPLATGAILQRPPGAVPPPEPDLGPVPGVPSRGLPAGSMPNPPFPKNRPVVPGTAAEPYETSVQTIKNAGAKTTAEVQKLFPKAQLSREQARDLRNAAWGKPTPSTPKESYAEGIRGNTEQLRTPGQVPEAGQETGGHDVEQKPPVQPQPVEPGKEAEQKPDVLLNQPAEPTKELLTQPGERTLKNDNPKPSLSSRYFHEAGDATANPDWWVNVWKRLSRGDITPQETTYQVGIYLRQLGPERAAPVIKALQKSRQRLYGIHKGLMDQMAKATTSEEKNKILSNPDSFIASMTQFPREAIEAAHDSGSAKGMVPESFGKPLTAQPAVEPEPEPAKQPTTGIADSAQHPIVEVPLSEISVSPDVPNFKGEADLQTGVVPGQELSGKYERRGTAPIVIWERLNGKKEIITGRHRLDLARRTGEKTIPAQIVREEDGFGQAQALTFDAESNIRDGQGSVDDYAHYFKNSPQITEAEARTRGLLSRAKGKAGWDMGKNAADDLYISWANKKIATDQAVAIARAAPGNADLQALGIKEALKGRSPDEIENFIKAVGVQTGGKAEQVDLFGRDDRAMAQAEKMGEYVTERQGQLTAEIRAIQGAAKRPELARKYGVDIKDPEGVNKKVAELKAEQTRWNNWSLHPDLVKTVLDAVKAVGSVASSPPEQDKTPTPEVKAAAPAGELFPTAETPFNLAGETAKNVPPKTETTGFGKETLTQHEMFGIQEVVRSVDPAKSADAATKMAGGDPAKAAQMLRRQLAIMDADPQSYKSFSKEQRNRLKNVIALLDQRGGSDTGKVLGFGGVGSRSTGTTPIAQTPSQLSRLIQTHTPGLNIVSGAKQGLQSLLLPSSKSPEHLHEAELLGARLGAKNRREESAATQLKGAGKFFDRLGVHNEKLAPDQNPGIKFMSDMSQGRPMTGKQQLAAYQVKKLFQDRLNKLEDAGAQLQSVRKNYFPGMWTRESREAFNLAMDEARKQGVIGPNDDVNNATQAQKDWVKKRVDQMVQAGQGSEADMTAYFTRSPLKGQESFRKQKVFDDIMTGAEFGLRPNSYNPIDQVKGKLAEMDKSIMANEHFRELKEEGHLKIISPYEETPEGWERINDKYGTIYGPPTVKVPEWIDKNVYEGLLGFAQKLGIKHERSMKFPRGPGQSALGLSYQGQNFVRTKFATETSVLAHEIGHQLDYRYDFWKTFVQDAVGLGKKGAQTKAASQKQRALIKNELRAVADLTGGRGGHSRERDEQIAQMVEAYVHAPEKMKEVAPTVFKTFDDFIKSKPDLKGLAEIKPNIELTKLTGEKYVGLPILGYRIVPKPVGDVLNNYLSSSLYNNKYAGPVYKAWMATANALNQTQLGLGSAFHAGFTTVDVQVSAGAEVLKDIYGVLRGNRSINDLANTTRKFTTASIETAITGDKILNAWRKPDGVIDPRIAQVAKAAELAGAGFKMEHGLVTEQTTKMVRDWYSGHQLRAAARSPIAMTELMMKPIMEYLVPRQKAGVFANMAWRIIEQHPDTPLEDLKPQFRQSWNRDDARLGQVRYNRLFINNAAKNLIQGLVRAPGWSGGTIAELGGAFPDAAKFMKEWATTGKLPENMPDRVAYTLSLLATVGAVNGALTYAFTGQMPNGMDYLAFRTGRKDKDGNDERFLIPSYVKDLLAYATHPITTLWNKTHPLVSVLRDLEQNRDYYGYEIRDPNAPASDQAGQVGKYVLSSFKPFWIRGEEKNIQEGASPGAMAAPYIGVMPAPAYVTRSAIQNRISELYHLRTGERTKPYDARQADQEKRSARDASKMDIYMFKRLPKSDKAALRAKMSPAEISRYFGGGGSMSAAEIRQIAPWARQSTP